MTPEQLVTTGGTWSGLLLEDGDDARLTWTFTFDFEPVDADLPSLVVDSVPISRARWRDMVRRSAASEAFGQPIEASLFVGSHHRYDRAAIEVLNQRGSEIHARARLAGDLDGLGIERVDVDAWLEFEGITVQLDDDTTNVEVARARLAELTEVDGLVGEWKGWNFVFRPGVV